MAHRIIRNREARDQEKWIPVFRPIRRQVLKLDGRLKGRPWTFRPDAL